MATGDNDDTYEQARFYSRDEIVDEQANHKAMLVSVVEQLPPLPFYLRLFSSDTTRRSALVTILEKSSVFIGRPLSQEEARQLATYNSEVLEMVIAFLPPPIDVERTLTRNLCRGITSHQCLFYPLLHLSAAVVPTFVCRSRWLLQTPTASALVP
jgi:hypothetical protein